MRLYLGRGLGRTTNHQSHAGSDQSCAYRTGRTNDRSPSPQEQALLDACSNCQWFKQFTNKEQSIESVIKDFQAEIHSPELSQLHGRHARNWLSRCYRIIFCATNEPSIDDNCKLELFHLDSHYPAERRTVEWLGCFELHHLGVGSRLRRSQSLTPSDLHCGLSYLCLCL